MGYQYKIIAQNRRIYREFTVGSESEHLSIGTGTSCEYRLNPEGFFGGIELKLDRRQEGWALSCDINELYISTGDFRKLSVRELQHGDQLSIRYSDSGIEVLTITFLIDWEAECPFINWFTPLEEGRRLSIGSELSRDIVLTGIYAAGSSIILSRQGGKVSLIEETSPYGVMLNGSRVVGQVELKDHDFFSVSDYQFYYSEGKVYFDRRGIIPNHVEISPLEKLQGYDYPKFDRNTRRKIMPDTEPITVLDPESMPHKPDLNIATSLMPTIAMLILLIVMSKVMDMSGPGFMLYSIFSMSIGVAASAAGIIHSRRTYRSSIVHREKTYREYIEKKRLELEEARQRELEELDFIYVRPSLMLDRVMSFESDIFDRTPSDEDFLEIYLGRGKRMSLRQVDCRRQERLESGDELMQIPETLLRDYMTIDNAPVTLKLREVNAVGIAGSEESIYELFKSILTDLVCRQYHSDESFYLIGNENSRTPEYLKLLPQFNEGTQRNLVFNNSSRILVMENLFTLLAEREEVEEYEKSIVIFVSDQHSLMNHPVARFVPKAAELGAVFVFFADETDMLPLHCDRIIELEDGLQGLTYDTECSADKQSFCFEEISDDAVSSLARRIAPVYCDEISLESSLRRNISLFETLGIYAVSDLDLRARWSRSEVSTSLAVPIGTDSRNELVYLDLHEKTHGPHGLVAGTTGSGKSELLQSYIIGAATLYHPHEVSFLIIDFKGGGMANRFSELPHLAGAITNIDGKEIERSLKSIKAELLHRQELFAEADVNHIDAYIAAYKSGRMSIPIPHLIIIVDEFAELKAEQPEFMKELISASRIGRSLGVHLILATQKPSGQVSEQIWSNSTFRLCLKVQNAEDSKEVLKSPLAAEIREPGRAYLQVGNNELFTLFQSAYSGSPADMDVSRDNRAFAIYEMGTEGRKQALYERHAEKKDKSTVTELEAAVRYISDYCRREGIEPIQGLCLPPLPEQLIYEDEKREDEMNTVAVGMYDAPEAQRQGKLICGIGRENTIIIGSSQTGKTNLINLCIKQLASDNSPQDVCIYIMDFDTATLTQYESLKHVGGVVTAAADEKVKNLFGLLMSEMSERRRLISDSGVGSFAAYREAGFRELGRLYLFIDNYNAFKEMYLESYEQQFLSLCRDGLSLGISVLATNSTANGIGFRFMSCFGNRFSLNCIDSSEYSSLFDRCRVEPDAIPGRLIFSKSRQIHEAQSYLAFEGEREIDRRHEISRWIKAVNNKYFDQPSAVAIPEIPKFLSREDFLRQFGMTLEQRHIPIGMNFTTFGPVAADMTDNGEFAVIAKRKEVGTKLTLQLIRNSVMTDDSRQRRIFILDSAEERLKLAADWQGVIKYTSDYEEYEDVLIRVRNIVEYAKQVSSSAEENLVEQAVLVINGRDAIKRIADDINVYGILEELAENYRYYGLGIIYGTVEDRTIDYSSDSLLYRIKNNNRALLAEPLTNVRALDIGYDKLNLYPGELQFDEAFWIDDTELSKVKLFADIN